MGKDIYQEMSDALERKNTDKGVFYSNLLIKIELQLKCSQSWKWKANVSIWFNSVGYPLSNIKI